MIFIELRRKGKNNEENTKELEERTEPEGTAKGNFPLENAWRRCELNEKEK